MASEKSSDRYLPQHPLPDEIKEMKRDGTVCQFCGVSYLIHNEIKNLQKELDACKEEVERLRHYDERENALINQVNTLNSKLKDLLEKRQLEEKKCLKYEDLLNDRNISISKLKNSLTKNCEELDAEKNNNILLHEKYESLKSIVIEISRSRNSLKRQFSEVSGFCKQNISNFAKELNKESTMVLNRISGLNVVYLNSHKEVIKLRKQTELTDKKYESEKQIIASLSGHLICYKEKIESITDKFKKLEENQLCLTKNFENRMINIVSNITKLKSVMTINHRKKSSSIDHYKEENTKLKEERSRIVNAHHHQIKQLNDSFKQKLLDAEKYTGKLDKELKELLVKFDEEKRLLLEANAESLNKAATESNLKYKQLNDDYEKCKREIRRLEEKLKMQQKKFAEEKNQFLQEITLSYEKATVETESRYSQMNEEKASHLKTIKKLEQHLESMQVKFHEEMLKQVEQHEKEKKNLEHHFTELSKQLESKQKHAIVNEEKNDLQEVIQKLQISLKDANNLLKEKSFSIEEYENELSTLRDCIRRECEERYELTEALAEARMELMSQQRFSKQSTSSSQLSVYKNRNSPHSKKLDGITDSHEKLEKLKENSRSISVGKNSMINLPTPSSAGQSKSTNKNRNSESSSRHSKNKLLISLKNR